MKKVMKSSLLIALIVLGLINIISPSGKVFADSPGEINHNIIVVFEGEEITKSFEVSAPFRLNGSVYMPAKVLNTALGLDVNFDKESNSIYIGTYNLKPEKN